MGYLAQKLRLNRPQGVKVYNMVYILSLNYSLPTTSLSIEIMEYIQRFAIDKFLSSMGPGHSAHWALLFDPLEYGGFDWYTEMIGVNLDCLISNITHGTKLGKSIRININILQLAVGLATPILESIDNLMYNAANWILSFRQYLQEIYGKLCFSNLWNPKPLCEHDLNICWNVSKSPC
jgi:hypothetical protein